MEFFPNRVVIGMLQSTCFVRASHTFVIGAVCDAVLRTEANHLVRGFVCGYLVSPAKSFRGVLRWQEVWKRKFAPRRN